MNKKGVRRSFVLFLKLQGPHEGRRSREEPLDTSIVQGVWKLLAHGLAAAAQPSPVCPAVKPRRLWFLVDSVTAEEVGQGLEVKHLVSYLSVYEAR